MATNYLKETLNREACTQAELSRRSSVCSKTISKLYHKKGPVSPITKRKILRGLNELSERSYSLGDIFPEEIEPLSLFLDLDSIDAKKAVEIINKLSEFYGAELKLVGFDGFPPTADFSGKKKKRAA